MEKKPKAQLNARVPAEMRRALKAVAVISGLSLERVSEDAFRYYLGMDGTSEDLQHRREICREALRRYTGGNPPPFEVGRSSGQFELCLL
jgi:hypothetical protein